MDRQFTILPSNNLPSPNLHQQSLEKLFSSDDCRIPWISYYFSDGAASQSSHGPFSNGLVQCPKCSHHLSNDNLLQHLVAHLYVDELHTGSMWPFEFCHQCLFHYDGRSIQMHREVHSHVQDSSQFASLMRGYYVCPTCEREFYSIVKFALHLYERHVFRDAPYVCPICYAFRASRHSVLMDHLRREHAFINQSFCPYCLKRFELPRLPGSSEVFTANDLYCHMRIHWDEMTYQCESCRLDFVHRRDLQLHEYSHHTVHRPTASLEPPDSIVLDRLRPTNYLSLFYTDNLRAVTPRVSLRCLECGESLRHPISKHFNLTVYCPDCRFSSSCSVAVHQHWCQLHLAPSVSTPASVSNVTDLSSQLTSWERCIRSLVAFSKLNLSAPQCAQKPHDRCGSLFSQMRQCKRKHAPPGMEYKGVLRCPCGFQTILGNRMARHLADGECHSGYIHVDNVPRVTLFPIVKVSSRTVRRIRHRKLIQLSRSPFVLRSVGLLSCND